MQLIRFYNDREWLREWSAFHRKWCWLPILGSTFSAWTRVSLNEYFWRTFRLKVGSLASTVRTSECQRCFYKCRPYIAECSALQMKRFKLLYNCLDAALPAELCRPLKVVAHLLIQTVPDLRNTCHDRSPLMVRTCSSSLTVARCAHGAKSRELASDAEAIIIAIIADNRLTLFMHLVLCGSLNERLSHTLWGSISQRDEVLESVKGCQNLIRVIPMHFIRLITRQTAPQLSKGVRVIIRIQIC